MRVLEKPIHILGCELDPDERAEAMEEKASLLFPERIEGPVEEVLKRINASLLKELIHKVKRVEVPAWLSPAPPVKELGEISLGHLVAFLDNNGCRVYSDRVAQEVEEILPDLPCLIGVDHSLSGGAMYQLSKYYGPTNITYIVLDAHTDGLPVSALLAGILYDIKTNPKSLFDPEDPYLRDRTDSYNASSFLLYGINEGWIVPENLILIGPCDLPPKKAYSIKDKDARKYVSAFKRFLDLGVIVIEKSQLSLSPKKLKGFLQAVRTPYVYISVDMDVGAKTAVEGVRFTERSGLNRNQILNILDLIISLVNKDVELVGFDLMEFNPRKRDPKVYDLAFEIISKLLMKSEKIKERS